jgi:fumarate reductase subunit C
MSTEHSALNTQPSYSWRMPAGWWLGHGRYFMYMMRELSAVFAALWLVFFLAQIPQIGAGAANLAAYVAWLDFIRSPGWVIFSVVTLVFVLYHAFTWFNLMGTVLYVRLGKTPIPGSAIVGLMFVAWAGISLIIALIIMTPFVGG